MATEEEDRNEYLDLPDDPEEAFAVLQRRKYKALEAIWNNNEGGGDWHHERRYVDNLIAFDEVHGLGILTTFRTPPSTDTQFSQFFQDFRRHAEIASQKILIEAARRQKTGAQKVVVLDSNARDAIHKLIEAIAKSSMNFRFQITNGKSLFNKLNAFAGGESIKKPNPY